MHLHANIETFVCLATPAPVFWSLRSLSVKRKTKAPYLFKYNFSWLMFLHKLQNRWISHTEQGMCFDIAMLKTFRPLDAKWIAWASQEHHIHLAVLPRIQLARQSTPTKVTFAKLTSVSSHLLFNGTEEMKKTTRVVHLDKLTEIAVDVTGSHHLEIYVECLDRVGRKWLRSQKPWPFSNTCYL